MNESHSAEPNASPLFTASRRALAVAGLCILAAAPALAAPPATQPVYGDELERCVVALRDGAVDAGAASVRHTVTGLEVRGLWREFTIETELAASSGESLGETVTECRTERWGPATQVTLLETRAPAGSAQLAAAPEAALR
jgi:hypothetical protein